MADFVLPQPGLFALGTPVQTFLEFDLIEPAAADAQLLTSINSLVSAIKTGQGCNVSIGVRPSLWARERPDASPPECTTSPNR